MSKNDQSPWVGESPPWDEALAQGLRGAYVLVGITFLRPDGALDERVQLHGRVSIADPERGIAVVLEGARKGETYWLPPDVSAFDPAPPGHYTLHASGEVVPNPAYLSTWKITRPAKS